MWCGIRLRLYIEVDPRAPKYFNFTSFFILIITSWKKLINEDIKKKINMKLCRWIYKCRLITWSFGPTVLGFWPILRNNCLVMFLVRILSSFVVRYIGTVPSGQISFLENPASDDGVFEPSEFFARSIFWGKLALGFSCSKIIKKKNTK